MGPGGSVLPLPAPVRSRGFGVFKQGGVMAQEIPVGTSHEIAVTVTPDMSPPHLKDVSVLSTPSMINLMEQCALQAMAPYLADGETSVGTEVCITHDAALTVGQEA